LSKFGFEASLQNINSLMVILLFLFGRSCKWMWGQRLAILT